MSGFFGSIAGYADLQCGTVTEPDPETGEDVDVADCEGQPPASETMSGLSVTDDLNFTVTLAAPETFFMTRLGYTRTTRCLRRSSPILRSTTRRRSATVRS